MKGEGGGGEALARLPLPPPSPPPLYPCICYIRHCRYIGVRNIFCSRWFLFNSISLFFCILINKVWFSFVCRIFNTGCKINCEWGTKVQEIQEHTPKSTQFFGKKIALIEFRDCVLWIQGTLNWFPSRVVWGRMNTIHWSFCTDKTYTFPRG